MTLKECPKLSDNTVITAPEKKRDRLEDLGIDGRRKLKCHQEVE
jgi:hypothetical protein